MLELGDFKVKEFVVEGEISQESENLLGITLFGYTGNAGLGLLHVKLSINMSKKVRTVRSCPNLTKNDIDTLSSVTMTK